MINAHVIDEQIGDEKRDCRAAGELEPFVAGVIADQDPDNSHQDPEIPKGRAADEKKRMPQGGAAKPRHQPDRGPHPGHRTPAVDERVEVRRPNPSPGEKTRAREKIGRMHLERSRARPAEWRAAATRSRKRRKTSTGRRVEASINARSTRSTSLVVTSTSPNGS